VVLLFGFQAGPAAGQGLVGGRVWAGRGTSGLGNMWRTDIFRDRNDLTRLSSSLLGVILAQTLKIVIACVAFTASSSASAEQAITGSASKVSSETRRVEVSIDLRVKEDTSISTSEAIIINPSGPDAERMGQKDGWPVCVQALTKIECRVGTWSANERVAAAHPVSRSSNPMQLNYMRDPPKITYKWGFSRRTVDEYLSDTKVTGLLIVKDGRVVLERYQYGRSPEMRFRSFSMAKTFTAMLVGIAHEKGYIKSLDDKVLNYWPEIASSSYGQTTVRNLLRMGSGVPFRELYTWTPDDDIWVWGRLLYSGENRGQPEKVTQYLNSKNQREVDEGTRFKYATIETEILGRVLHRATGKSVAKLTEEWLWHPMGSESDSYWLIALTDNVEATGGGFNATLRDYGRFGVLLANDGKRDDNQIIPKEFLLDATDPQRLPAAFRPKIATGYYGYGYQTWILPMRERTFALQGIHGQLIFVQPSSKIVMVQTAVFDGASGRQDSASWNRALDLWRGVLQGLGGNSQE